MRGPESFAVRRARHLVKAGRFAEAVEILSAHVRDHPSDARAWDWLARAYFEMGALEDAEAACEKVVNLWPEKARCWTNLGMIRRKLGDLAGAQSALARAIKLDPDYHRAREELAKVRRLLMLPRCAACQAPVGYGELHTCPTCGWHYHERCWQEQGGCVNQACGHTALADEQTTEEPSSSNAVRYGCVALLVACIGLAVALILLLK